jgi:hypothetical protein
MTALNAGKLDTVRALSAVEIDEVAGGLSLPYYAAFHMWVSPLDIRALNPQPLPPGPPPPDMFMLGLR